MNRVDTYRDLHGCSKFCVNSGKFWEVLIIGKYWFLRQSLKLTPSKNINGSSAYFKKKANKVVKM